VKGRRCEFLPVACTAKEGDHDSESVEEPDRGVEYRYGHNNRKYLLHIGYKDEKAKCKSELVCCSWHNVLNRSSTEIVKEVQKSDIPATVMVRALVFLLAVKET
jgi:hypothetical protein